MKISNWRSVIVKDSSQLEVMKTHNIHWPTETTNTGSNSINIIIDDFQLY